MALLLLISFTVSALASPYSDPHCAQGRDSFVQLFEWKWDDVRQECERFLGPYGFCGVQVSPPSENAVVTNPYRPWYERYQPVAYNIMSRSGNEQQFKEMLNACNKVNVRVYANVIINHMTGSGYSGNGVGGTVFDGTKCNYPGVPFSAWDFNGRAVCHTSDLEIHNYQDANEVRNCRLQGMCDLQMGKEYVRNEIATFLNKLISFGVAGFRVDAAKHMWPGDLENIFARLNDLRSDVFGSGMKPFIVQEVIDLGGEPIKMSEYFNTGRVTNFIYGVKLADIFLHRSNQAKWLTNFGEAWGMPDTKDSVVFINNHDNQRGTNRRVITFEESKQLKISTAFMLAHPYGFPRIMSSYRWDRAGGQNDWMGPPHNSDMSTKDVLIKPDMSCLNGWVCEHRWRQIFNMVAFRNVVAGTPLQNWHSFGDFQIAFSRGNKGFIVIVADESHLVTDIHTDLSPGVYCDVISGNYENGVCTGKSVQIDNNGVGHFDVDGQSEDPVMAIHIGAKVGSPKKVMT